MRITRRNFIGFSALAGMLLPLAAFAGKGNKKVKTRFNHVVYFWLNNPGNEAERAMLLSGIKTLGKIESLRQFHVGKPAATSRPVIDSSYDFSLLTVFEDMEGHDIYQVHPIHLKFIEEHAHLWKKVLVYDSVDA